MRVLQLEFRNGLAYEYFGVPAALYTDLLSAQSKGTFVTRFIRGHFPFRRLGTPRRSDVVVLTTDLAPPQEMPSDAVKTAP